MNRKDKRNREQCQSRDEQYDRMKRKRGRCTKRMRLVKDGEGEMIVVGEG